MNNNNGKGNGETREFPIQKSAPSTEGSAPTRQIPVQKAPATERQIPVKRTTAPADDMTMTRQTPVKRTAAPADDMTMTRQTPVKRTAAPADDMTMTRQTPVKRTAAPTDDMTMTRQTPVKRTAAPADDMTMTRQTPVKRTAAPTDDMTMTRQTPVKRTAENPSDLTITKPIPVKRTAEAPSDLGGTKQIPATGGISAEEIKKLPSEDEAKSPEKKKKKSFFADDKSDDDEGTALISVIKAVVYIVAVLVISVSASIFIILVGNDVFAFVKSEETVEVTVPEDADIDDIARLLADNNVIKYPGIFKWYANHNDDDGKFIAGKYTVPMNLDYDDLRAVFKEQRDEGTSWVTIPEGFTTDEIIDMLVEAGIGTKEGYVDVINNYPFDYWFVKELDGTDWKASGRYYRLDGYLFPDTYEFYNESTEKAVINKLLARFNVIFGKKYKEAAETMGMDVDTIVTIASMIEKEAGTAADYHLVSSVFHNRLASDYFPKLESDATALYAIHHDTGERPTEVTGKHMQYDSPYNTYLYDGLPPGPIANPSASAINAALTPETSNYYFFVSYNTDTYFAATNAEHENNKAMIAQLKNKQSEDAAN